MDRIHNLFGIVIIIGFLVIVSCNQKEGKLETTLVEPEGVEDIRQLNDSLVKPVDYMKLISLKHLTIKERKVTFINQILPSILICKHKLELEKDKIAELGEKIEKSLNKNEQRYLDSLFLQYKTNNIEELLLRINTHPSSLVIAQAALESAWGTSRFYIEGNNVFGIWSFSAKENRMPSKGLRDGKPVYLKMYNTLTESVADYFLVLARGPYTEFRQQRKVIKNPVELSSHLTNYSELDMEYVRRLNQIIRKNDLKKYDNYKIDPRYIK